MLRLPIDEAAMGFIAAGVPEPVLDFETRRPKADANGVALFEVNAMAMVDGRAEAVSIRTAGAVWLADIAHHNRQQQPQTAWEER
jgi:hypothetical protein